MAQSLYPAPQSAVLLCIDNDNDLLECQRMFLESAGYTVLTAASGDRGLELAASRFIDVVILEYSLPEMSGHEVAKKLRRIRPEAAIIMLTAGLGIPDHTLDLVDVLIAKECLAEELLPAIAQLNGAAGMPPVPYDA
jgi:DNA-binding response OmpR family regulator